MSSSTLSPSLPPPTTPLTLGLIGAICSIPGTLLSYPLDSLKIRQQTNSLKLFDAIKTQSSTVGFTRGVGAAVGQKIITRFPMFLVSSVSVSYAENYVSPLQAAFLGSSISGYVTGSIASISEYSKVLKSTGQTNHNISSRAIKTHGKFKGIQYLLKRSHFCGTRNACFDSIFFSTKYYLTSQGYSNAVSYAFAAGFAVIGDYSFDVVTKRILALPPETGIDYLNGIIWETLLTFQKEGRGIFKGLGMKSGEFAVSYAITGMCAGGVMKLCEGLID